MPPVGALIAAAATAIKGITLSSIIFKVAISVGLGLLQSALAPKPKSSNFRPGSSIKSSGITQNVRQAITVRRTLYGEARIGGTISFIETTSNDKYLHMVIVLADHEIEEIGEIWFDDVSIPPDALDGSGNVTTGRFANKARIKKHLGTSSQTADTDLVSETTVDSDFRGRDVAYIYARLEHDRDVYPSTIPVITAFCKGKKLYDPRDAMERYSANAIMFVNDHLTEPADSFTPGCGASQARVNEDAFIASVNASEEMVDVTAVNDTILSADASKDTLTLTGINDRLQYQTGDRIVLSGTGLPGGTVAGTDYYIIAYQRKDTIRIKLATTLANALAGIAIDITSSGTGTIRKTGEPRYFGGGIVEHSEDDDPKKVLEELLTACGGYAVKVGQTWFLDVAKYSTPEYDFSESHIISPITLRTKVTRRDRYNQVKGVYASPLNDGETQDYPAFTGTTYAVNDGKTIPTDHNLPFTQRPHTAQRLAKIRLEKHRQEQFFEAEFMFHALRVKPGDTIYLTIAKLGWSSKVFEVITVDFGQRLINNVPLFYVKLALQETAAEVYDWNNGEETAVDPAPNTNLRNPFIVTTVVGFSIDSLPVGTQDGDIVYNCVANWDAHTDPYVVSGGTYEIEYKESLETTYKSMGLIDGTLTSQILQALKPDILYDLRIFAYNNLGVKSQPSDIFNFQVGDTLTTDTEDWENETAANEDWETDTAASEDWE